MGIAYIVKERMRQAEAAGSDLGWHRLSKFIFLLLCLIAYSVYATKEYGLEYGISITALTWAFFVMCTPVADAGFLIDFPVRLAVNIRMFYTEIGVWVIAILINVLALAAMPGVYEKTLLLKLFYHIMLNPYPFWAIIFLSGIGTFLSIHFGDELVDAVSYNNRTEHAKHKLKHDFILFLFVILLVVLLYDFLLMELGVEIPL